MQLRLGRYSTKSAAVNAIRPFITRTSKAPGVDGREIGTQVMGGADHWQDFVETVEIETIRTTVAGHLAGIMVADAPVIPAPGIDLALDPTTGIINQIVADAE